MSKVIYREKVVILKNGKDIGDISIIMNSNMFRYPILSDWRYGEMPDVVITRPYCAFELFGLNINHSYVTEHNAFVDKIEQLEKSLGITIDYRPYPKILPPARYLALFGKLKGIKFKPNDIFEFKKFIQWKDSDKVTVKEAMELLNAKDFYQFMYDNDPCNGHSKIIGFWEMP